MPPSLPDASLTALSDTSFRVTVNGDPGVTNRIYYRLFTASVFSTGPTISGDGSADVTLLQSQGQYQVYVVSDDGSSYSLPYITSISLATVDTLTSAIHSRFYSQAPLTALITGGLWTGEIPERVAMPYCWLDLTDVNIQPSSEYQLDYGIVTFTIYAEGAAATEACGKQLGISFDYQTLTFPSTKEHVSCLPLNYRLRCENIRSKQGELIWRFSKFFQIITQQTR